MEITYDMKAADWLREIKKATKWQQKEIAKKLDVSAKTISLWINGKNRPSASQEEKIKALYIEEVEKKLKKSKVREEIEKIQARNGYKDFERTWSEEERTYYEAKQYVMEVEKSYSSLF